MLKFFLIVSMLALFLLVPSLAPASNFWCIICFDYEVQFGDQHGGDYWTDTSEKIGRGMKVKITRNYDSVILYNDYALADNGCLPESLQLSSERSYNITAYTEAKFDNNNKVKVENNDDANAIYYQVLAPYFIPEGSQTYTFTYQLSELKLSNIAAAAGYTTYKRATNLLGLTSILYTQPFDEDGGNGFRDNAVYLDDLGRNRKYIIAHELGHHLASHFNGDDGDFNNFSADGGSCPDGGGVNDHHLNSKEYQTAGATEGFAHFISAGVWNNISETDCFYHLWAWVDYDWDTFHDTYEEDGHYSCEDYSSYMEEWCNTPWDNRSVEIDWLKFWWDLLTNTDATWTNIENIWDEANPDTWDATNVYSRLRNAAINEDIDMDDWDYWANHNGVDH